MPAASAREALEADILPGMVRSYQKRQTGRPGPTGRRGGFVAGKQDGAHFDVNDIGM